MSCNLGTIIGGPAVVTFKGATFYSKGDISLSTDLERFTVDVDAFGGPVDEREANAPLSLSFVPAGKWDALAVLYPYANPVIGASIVAVTKAVAIDAGDDTIEVPNHRLRTGAPVRFAVIGGTIITGLTAGTLYWINAVDADNISVHTSEADALAGTSPIAMSALGSGATRVIEQEPLLIQTVDGTLITFHVAAVTQMPDFLGGATQTPLGAVTFEIFRKNGIAASTADSRYAITSSVFAGDPAFDPSQIVTQPYTASWGSAPWDSFSSKNGFRVSFPTTLSPIEDDACGIIGRRLSSVRAEVRGQPTNVDEAAALTALKLQGAGAGRGRRLTGTDLNLVGTGIYVRVYGAILTGAPQTFSSQLDRAGEFSWTNTRTFTGGVPGPVFYVGATAPA